MAPELEADVFDFNSAESPEAGEPELDENGDPLPPKSPLEFLQQQLLAVEAERDEMNDKRLRALAEGENIRRRAMKDREEAEKYGGVRLARDMLAVYDNLHRALEAADEIVREGAPEFIEGVELTKRELLNVFAKHKIAPVSPELGDKFDANKHQAMFESPAPGAENNTIIQVMQPGFMIADRLLRAAMVGVAKNPAGAAPAPADEPSADSDPEQTN
jgi:molecular chaperone GrpE